jgi:hypothetical protein
MSAMGRKRTLAVYQLAARTSVAPIPADARKATAGCADPFCRCTIAVMLVWAHNIGRERTGQRATGTKGEELV